MYYAVLPTTNNEYTFLLSKPFIKALDLSKQEISLLFLQEIQRNNMGIVLKYLRDSNLKSYFKKNFYKKKIPVNQIKKILHQLDDLYLYKGFSFQDQFKLTKSMDIQLKSDLKVWSGYLNLLKKIDHLVKTNVLYKEYIQKFPSPELQIIWLTDPYKKESNL